MNRDPPRTDVYYSGLIPVEWANIRGFGSFNSPRYFKPLIFVHESSGDVRDENGRRVRANLNKFSSFGCRPPLYNFVCDGKGGYKAFCRASRFTGVASKSGTDYAPCCGVSPQINGGCTECRLYTMI